MSADWLSQLAPDRAPPPVGWWPPAPGWWGLAALALVGTAAGVWLWWRRHRTTPRHWRRAALRELAELRDGGADDRALALGLQQLLRRYAMARYGREAVAGLSGSAWIDFVVSHGGTSWADETGQSLLRCAYGGRAAAQRERWLQGARDFIGARG